MILEAIIKYWVAEVCALIAAGIAFFAKRYVKLEKKDLANKQKERMTELRKEVKDEIVKEIAGEIDNIQQETQAFQVQLEELKEEDIMLHGELKDVANTLNGVTAGVLCIQGKDFKAECRRLLTEDHKISTDEFEELEDQY